MDDFGGVGIANCPNCLTPLEVVGPDESPYFLCGQCGLVRLVE